MKKPLFSLMIITHIIIQSSFSQTISLKDLGFTFSAPLHLTHANDGSGNLYVVERTGKIIGISEGTTFDFLDLSIKVYKTPGEMGLLGLAFHPDYKNNGYIYVNYNTKESDILYTNISRFKANDGVIDITSELTLLKIIQPYENHNGGTLLFGNDGYLYIALGDGGSGGDPLNNAQNLSVLLGKILRIDVDNGSPYSIPAGNPYKGNSSGYKEEVYAYGLRNPWKMSIDKTNGRIWAADVGQAKEEEIDIIENGKNYGWRIMEGNSCYNPSSNCTTTGVTPPIYSYTREVAGTCSVTGGFVYRGSKITELTGLYIYGDFCSGDIWALDIIPTYNKSLINTDLFISSFGEDENGELYVLDINGKVYKIEGTTASITTSNTSFFTIRPNPASDQLYISIPENDLIKNLEIYDGHGSKIKNTEFYKNSPGGIVINTANLKAGVYTLSITVDNIVLSEKFVVIK